MGRLSKRVINRKETESKKKRQTMKKYLFKTRLLSFAAFCSFALAFVSCANGDVAQSTTGTETDNDKNLTTFVAGDEAKTRTSMDYTSGDFYWEAGDYIYVKDDKNIWQISTNTPTAKVASFKFKVPGKFTKGNTYKVYYPGKNGSYNQVTIPAFQTQTAPNTTDHFGESGDCGTADASWSNAKNGFAFTLDHQAAILVFQPYTSNTVLKDCYLTKIEVNSDNDITHTYTLDPISGELTGGSGSSSSKQVTLTTRGSGAYSNGFPLTNTTASVTTNGAYMVIKPGTHTLKVRYWIKDVVSNIEGTITKILGSYTYAKNTYYDMNAELKVKGYDGDHYYMWDAQQQYWYNWEWTKNLPGGQPILGQPASSNYPKSNTDPRWYRTGVGPFQATQSCANCPNVNEMVWYVKRGDPHWDKDELWSTMGHLQKGGVWFKKKANIPGFNVNADPNGSDWRQKIDTYSIGILTTLPSAAVANQYFYLPALGMYHIGDLNNLGSSGYYWSSSTGTGWIQGAYYLYFDDGSVRVNNDNSRGLGHRVDGVFE